MKLTLNKKPEQTSLGQARLEHTHSPQGNQIGYFLKQNAPALIVVSILIVCVMTAPTFGVSVEALKAPVKTLRDDIFGGWMWVAKIGAAVGGCVMAVYQRDIVPLATGAAVGLGIHFYDGYFGDPTAGALI
jgi:hypothetical protein